MLDYIVWDSGEAGGFRLFVEIKAAHSIVSLAANALVMSLLIHPFLVQKPSYNSNAEQYALMPLSPSQLPVGSEGPAQRSLPLLTFWLNSKCLSSHCEKLCKIILGCIGCFGVFLVS